jgi:hypothetical protein
MTIPTLFLSFFFFYFLWFLLRIPILLFRVVLRFFSQWKRMGYIICRRRGTPCHQESQPRNEKNKKEDEEWWNKYYIQTSGGVSPTGLPTSSRHPKFPKKISQRRREEQKSEAHKGEEIINEKGEKRKRNYYTESDFPKFSLKLSSYSDSVFCLGGGLTLKTGLPSRLSSREVIHKLVLLDSVGLLDSGSSHSSVSFCVDNRPQMMWHANYFDRAQHQGGTTTTVVATHTIPNRFQRIHQN